MTRFYFIFIFGFLFLGLVTNAQESSEYSSTQLLRAQNNFNTSRNRVQMLIDQLTSIDSTYKSGESLFKNSLKSYRKSKSAFKTLESNYKAQINPYRRHAYSKDKIKSAEAREMVKIIKARFQSNGESAANNANLSSKKMVRAKKIMKHAKMRRRAILPRLNKTIDLVNKWGLILYEMGNDSISSPKKTIY